MTEWNNDCVTILHLFPIATCCNAVSSALPSPLCALPSAPRDHTNRVREASSPQRYPRPVHKQGQAKVQQPPKNYVLFTNLTHLYLPMQSSDHWCQIPCFYVLIALGSTIMHLNLQDMSMSYAQLLFMLSQVRCSAQTVLTVASLYT